ncbi:MAG: zinc-dependent alcohol dehydrogenase family protein [Pseudomonas sp.]|uniref:zinc-dependent alcohol dehydrogenase family protein n=1 Tax=Pseudomonas sp. TaxID=306 RepID=UPI00339AB0BD
MSRMIRFHQFGPAEVLKCEEVPVGQPGPGEVLLQVEAIGLSWHDVLWRQNLAPCQASLPSGLGHEMAGQVLAVGEGVDDLVVGDKVASFPAHSTSRYPGYAEQMLLPRTSLTRYPEVLSPVEASGFFTPLLMAYFAYVELARLVPGQTVLITDGSRCAGPSAIQLGKALGARVIAATKDGEDREYLMALGADKVIVTEEQDLVQQIAKLTDGRGVDVVLDGLGGPQMCLLGDVLATRGRLVLYGLQGGNQTPFPACAAFQKNIQFFVHCLGNFTGKPELGIPQDRAALERALLAINQLTRDGLLRPQVDRVFPFEQFVEAHRYLENGPCRGQVALQV